MPLHDYAERGYSGVSGKVTAVARVLNGKGRSVNARLLYVVELGDLNPW